MSKKGHRMFSAQRIDWSVFGGSAARSYDADVRDRYVEDPRIKRRLFRIGFDVQYRIPSVPLPHCGRPRCVFESGDAPAPQCLAPLRCLSGYQRRRLHVVSLDAFFARLLRWKSSLPLNHDFEVLAWQHQRTVAGAISCLHEGQQVLGEGSLLLGIKCSESLVHRTVVGAEDFDPVCCRTVAKDELAGGRPDLLRGSAEKLLEPCLRAPQCR